MRLNLGAADVTLSGYTSVDVSGADITHDLSVFPWPFADASAEAILASHVLEHLTLADARRFLSECARILRPGAVLALAVPDMDRFIEAWRTGDFSPLAGYAWPNLNTFLGGGDAEIRPAWRHQHLWNWSALAWELQRVGLIPELVTFDTSALGNVHTSQYRAISVYVDGIKEKGAAE